MISNEELWLKLREFKIIRYVWDENKQETLPENLELSVEVLSNYTNEFFIFIQSLNMSLKIYPIILNGLKEEGKINYNYVFYCNTILINLITSLECYLEGNFRRLASRAKIEDLDMEIFVKFVKEFRIGSEYFIKALKEYSSQEFYVSYILPDRMDFQQKNKAKIAYNLFNLYLPEIADDKQDIWERIFGNKTGYIELRHEIIHAGIVNSLKNKVNGNKDVDEDLIFAAALDISKFVYNLDELISMEFPKSEYPNLYPKKVKE